MTYHNNIKSNNVYVARESSIVYKYTRNLQFVLEPRQAWRQTKNARIQSGFEQVRYNMLFIKRQRGLTPTQCFMLFSFNLR